MKTVLHAAAGTLALALVSTFLASTIISELCLDYRAITIVKTAIFYGVFLLVPLMAITGGSGFALAANRSGGLVERKKARMRIIGANGLLVMLPAAVFLYFRASVGSFDGLFYVVQIIELAGGMLQLCLLILNFRDGRRMTEKKRLLAARNTA
nr:hypothetical protein [Rhizobium sp. ACO-34A]